MLFNTIHIQALQKKRKKIENSKLEQGVEIGFPLK